PARSVLVHLVHHIGSDSGQLGFRVGPEDPVVSGRDSRTTSTARAGIGVEVPERRYRQQHPICDRCGAFDRGGREAADPQLGPLLPTRRRGDEDATTRIDRTTVERSPQHREALFEPRATTSKRDPEAGELFLSVTETDTEAESATRDRIDRE